MQFISKGERHNVAQQTAKIRRVDHAYIALSERRNEGQTDEVNA